MTLAGTAVAQAIVPPLANWLITEFGWRAAFVWMAFGWGGLTFLLSLLFFVDGREEPKSGIEANEATDHPALSGLTSRKALLDRALWQVAISNFVVMALTMGLTIHLFPILTEAGVTRERAAWLVSLAGVAGIVGKLATGYLLDRLGRTGWAGSLLDLPPLPSCCC